MKQLKRLISLVLAASLSLALVSCGGNSAGNGSGSAGGSSSKSGDLTPTQQIIQEAQGMTMEELAKKAIEESNGKMFYGVGNSSRGKSALPLFIEYLQSIDPSYNMEFEWQQPKNNKIFDQLTRWSSPACWTPSSPRSGPRPTTPPPPITTASCPFRP